MDAVEGELAQRLLGSFMHFNRLQWRRHHQYGLRPHDYFMLYWTRRLTEAEGVPPRASELRQRLGVAAPTVTQHVARLEKAGLLERVMDTEDRRSVRIRVTEQGGRTFAAARTAFLATFGELAEYLGPERAKELVSLLVDASSFLETHSARTDEEAQE